MKVLITRPEEQAKQLAVSLKKHNISSICFPVIAIVEPTDIKVLRQVSKNINSFDILIFVSPNAAERFLQNLKLDKLDNEIFAVGKGTASVLQQYDIKVTAYPKHANSEGLLTLPELQIVNKKNIAIFAGEEGKTILQQELAERGAKVKMIYTHRRQLPEYKHPLSWSVQSVDVSICTSLSGLSNFRTIIAGCALEALLKKPLLVITDEMKVVAQYLGFKSVIILAKGASNQQIVSALEAYSLTRK